MQHSPLLGRVLRAQKSLHSISKRYCVNPSTYSFAQTATRSARQSRSTFSPPTSEQFCFKTERKDCTVLESNNTDWSISLTGRNTDEQLIRQLYALLLVNPISAWTTEDEIPVHQGTLTGVLPKESYDSMGLKAVPLRRKPNLSLEIKTNESSAWTIGYSQTSKHVAEQLSTALRSLQEDVLLESSQTPSPRFADSAHHITLSLPSHLLIRNRKETLAKVVNSLAHHNLRPFATQNPAMLSVSSGTTCPKIFSVML